MDADKVRELVVEGRRYAAPYSVYSCERGMLSGQITELADACEALLDRVAELEAASLPCVRVLQWLPDGKGDDVYLGTQIRGVDNDCTPTLGELRRLAQLLAKK